MKNSYQKVIIIAGILVAVISLLAVQVEASNLVPKKTTIIENSLETVSEFLTDVVESVKADAIKEVRIYNSEDNLIRVAKEGSILLKPVINRADYLLEVDNVKYYRINK
ncbi:hypothetical protein ACFLU5_06060 [Bacteroidota bacterium]